MDRYTVILVIAAIILLLTAGCEESQQNGSKVWGNGDLPIDYVQMFGNDNNDRLNFWQNQVISNHEIALVELIKRVQALEMENPAELAERVRKVEDDQAKER